MSTQKFPHNQRLTHSSEFDAVFDQCEARVSEPALLFLAKQNDQGFNRLGMIVAKKNISSAVGRNKVKRLIREAFRKTLSSDHAGFDVVVMARPRITNEKDLNGVLQRSFKSIPDKLVAR